jgi:hypothetical protein
LKRKGCSSPSPYPAEFAVCHEHLSEAGDGISDAPEYPEAISGLRDLKRPTEGKEEATEGQGQVAGLMNRGHAVEYLETRAGPESEVLWITTRA